MKMTSKRRKNILADQKKERKQKKKELSEYYNKLVKRWEEMGWERHSPLRTQAEYVAYELKKFEETQLKIPTGKYKDEDYVGFEYREKFFEFIILECPEVIDELRELSSIYKEVFTDDEFAFLNINNWHGLGFIFDMNFSIEREIANRFKVPQIFDRESFVLRKLLNEYKWGRYQSVLYLLYLKFVDDNPFGKEELLELITQHFLSVFIINKDPIEQLLDKKEKYNESFWQSYLKLEVNRIINEILIDEDSYIFELAKRGLQQFLKSFTKGTDESFENFLILHTKILRWIERHHLKKSWIIEFAYFFVMKFSEDKNIDLKEIDIPYRKTWSLVADKFEFEFEHWLPGKDSKEDYEKRLIESFEMEKDIYFHRASKYLSLDEKKNVTKPTDIERVKWLVRWTVQGWSKQEIQKEVESENIKKDEEIERETGELPKNDKHLIDIKTIEAALKSFNYYNLPVRK
jgi:hypothetical protein